jgi:hypothetical protein
MSHEPPGPQSLSLAQWAGLVVQAKENEPTTSKIHK